MRELFRYLNPIAHFGEKRYSSRFPFLGTLCAVILLEAYVNQILRNPNAVGVFAIVIFLALIIYFAFRDGIRGGLITTAITIAYYFYIIRTRNYTGERLQTSLLTVLILGILYVILGSTIGWLRQKIDLFLEKEYDEKNRLQTILHQLPVGVITTNTHGVIDYANKRADMILGTKVPLGFKVGKTFFVNVIESKPSQSSHALLAKTLSTGKPLVNEEFTIETEGRKKVYIKASVSPIRNKRGKIIAAAEILNDITVQREHEMRKDDFVNMASHELKTPLTSMKLYIDSLYKRLREGKDERAMNMTKSIKFQTERLQALVSDLLDVSRIQTGKLSFQKEEFSIDTLVNDTADALQGLTRHPIIVQTNRSPIKVHADRFRIYQVLTNLINNALKYSLKDQTEIIIRIKRTGSKVIVSVSDFGIGIAKENQKKIFDRLYQVTDQKEKTFPGLGMGLYISKEIVKRHRGNIWVESEKDKGSTFYFSLPLTNRNNKRTHGKIP